MKSSFPFGYTLLCLLICVAQGRVAAQDWNTLIKQVGDSSERSFGDAFGYSVAISGDYAIVGAIHDDDTIKGPMPIPMQYSGAAYIFQRIGGTWQQIKRFTRPTPDGEDYFGRTVAISEDFAAVSVAYDDGNGPAGAAGTIYLYARNEGGADNWGFVRKINAPVRAAYDEFGYSMAISGDYLVVGAYHEDEDEAEANYAEGAGAAYLFARHQGGTDQWGLVKKITAPVRAALDVFGYSVAVSGETVLVGTMGDSEDAMEANPLFYAGAAYVFSRNQGGADNWGLVKKITAPVRAAMDYFGSSVAISGDFALVGAIWEDSDAAEADSIEYAGAGYVFGRNQGGADNWGLVQKIVAPARYVCDNFGSAVAISGDYALVGVAGEDEDVNEQHLMSRSGSAYLFARNQGGADHWGLAQKIVAPVRAENDHFGYSVAISGNVALIGAIGECEDAQETNTIPGAGAVYFAEQEMVAPPPPPIDTLASKFAAWSNPTTDWLIITSETETHATLTDATGHVLMRISLVAGENNTNISHLPAGMYLLQNETGKTVRVVKE